MVEEKKVEEKKVIVVGIKKLGRPKKYASHEEFLAALRAKRYEKLGREKMSPPGRKPDPNLTPELRVEKRRAYDREYYKNHREKIKKKNLAFWHKKKELSRNLEVNESE